MTSATRIARWRRVWTYRHVENKTWREIALLENVSKNRVGQLLNQYERWLIWHNPALNYTPPTSTDPDGVEAAWSKLTYVPTLADACTMKQYQERGL